MVATSLALIMMSKSVIAADNRTTLAAEREQAARQYVADLGKADSHDIIQLFAKDGYVISTSRGKMDAKEFFQAFLPNISKSSSEWHQYFNETNDVDRFAARFHFIYQMKDGEQGEGEYVDEFIFEKNSNKLTAVYMFENLKLGKTS